jgi:tight adherence protein B
MGLFTKGPKIEREPAYYRSATNIKTVNYRVYYMNPLEKAAYFLLAFAIGAAVGYLFYGGIGKDEFGRPTALTYTLNVLFSGGAGLFAGLKYIPMRTTQIIAKRKRKLAVQFRDMLEALNTSLGAGKNIPESFAAVSEDLKVQYEEDAYILNELKVILSGVANNVDIEDVLWDLGARSGIDDISSFANVFRVCYRKGGNIKDTIRGTHEVLSDKMEIREDIETVVTANKTEQSIMVVMPIALVGMIKLMSPDFASNFTSVAGVVSTTIAAALFITAHFIGKEVLDIRL